MDNAIKSELTGEQAAQLSELIEECLQELQAGDDAWEHRQAHIAELQAETKATIKRMQQRVREGQHVEKLL